MSAPFRVGFLGNRYGGLSFRLFRGAVASCTDLGIDLVLIDSSRRSEAAWVRRSRDRIVATAKRGLGVSTPTETLDWFRKPEARMLPQRTPPGHDLNAPGFAESLAAEGVGGILVAGCDQIVRRSFLRAVPRVVNFHNSLLPRYRGVNAVQWAFLNREQVSGFTFHTIESEEIDLGRIVLRDSLPILPEDSPAAYSSRMIERAAGACGEALRTLLRHSWPPEGAPLEGGSYYGRKEMASVRRFDPTLPVEELIHRERILGSLDVAAGSWTLRLSGFEPGSDAPIAGAMDWHRAGSALVVPCRDGSLVVRRIEHLPAALFAPLLPRRLPGSGKS